MRFVKTRLFAYMVTAVTAVSLSGVVFAGDIRTAPSGRFTIQEFMPVVDPAMVDIRQMYIGADARIRGSDLIPSGIGGITRTRTAVRSEDKDATWLTVIDREPAYRVYQILSRGSMVPTFVPTLSWAGAEHVLLGRVSLKGYTFESDPSFPLHFKLVQDVGYVYLCGRGMVATPQGGRYTLGQDEQIDQFILDLSAEETWVRAAASEALGWLAKTQTERDKAVPALLKALGDDAMEVRRNAASALGRIGDPQARDGLAAAHQDKDEWVREVVDHALKKLGHSPPSASP